MISKTELSGWYDRMCFRAGWSAKISKRKWMIIQITFPMLVIFALSFPIAKIFGTESWVQIFLTGSFIVLFSSLFGHKDWDRDQQKLRDKEYEETVTL